MKEHGEVFTPKEYAEWVVDRYMGSTYPFNQENIGKEPHVHKAKECALLSIEEILMSTRMLVNHYIRNNGVKAYMDIELSKNLTLAYYREVKQEIEKL